MTHRAYPRVAINIRPLKPRGRHFVALVALGLLLSACGYRESWEKALADRAPFELNCPKDQLVIAALTKTTYGNTDAPLYQGAQGCGRRVVYVATDSGYVLNSDSGTIIAAQPSGQPLPPPPPIPPPGR